MSHYTLYELNSLVQGVIEHTLGRRYWVEAELSDAAERRGHLYLDLIQKDDGMATPVARASAKCWASVWNTLRVRFMRVAGQSVRAGMKVLLEVYPQFHPAYGFSWIVTDIDPTYTLGDMARHRQEIIERLKAEGVFDLQRELPLPLFCRRIAVISAETAAGYGDFSRQLADNEYGFVFETTLFDAVMQGERVEQSVVCALNRVYERMDDFDCVVIIRGGGATTDMSGFDTLELAENVANFPLPIITGIGHDRDECILDLVSNTRVKTPTAAAAYLIAHLADTKGIIDRASERVVENVRHRLEREKLHITNLSARVPVLFSLVRAREESRLARLNQRLASAAAAVIQHDRHHLDIMMQRLSPAASRQMETQRHRIQMLGQRVAALDPQLILARGYSMTLVDGHVVTDAEQIADGATIVTRLAKGMVTSRKIE